MEQQREWPEPIMPEDSDSIVEEHIEVIDINRTDLLTCFAKEIAAQVQFPVNTVFVHGLGVIASAMTKSFSYMHFGKKSPVNLYIVTSQPPGSGKSGVNDFYFEPIEIAFTEFNKKQKVKIAKLLSEQKTIKTDLKKATQDEEIDGLTSDLINTNELLDETPVYEYVVTNTTPEALESLCYSQDNMWNVVSDEAGAINVLLGNMYSENELTNADIVLKSWDADYSNVQRVSRKTGSGRSRGTIAVIAQDETISTILKAGSRGNGVSERFLLYREPDIMGTRDFKIFKPVNEILIKQYAMLVSILVFSDKTTFTFSEECDQMIIENKMKIEPHLMSGKMYSNNMLRGTVAKMDKQVKKISCVLHVVEHWGKCQPTTINVKTVEWAIQIYKQLIKMYISAADSQGFIGDKSEIEEMLKQFRKYLSKGKNQVSVTSIRDLVKHRPIFKGRAKLSTYLRENVLPGCEKLNLCVCIGGVVWINSKLLVLI